MQMAQLQMAQIQMGQMQMAQMLDLEAYRQLAMAAVLQARTTPLHDLELRPRPLSVFQARTRLHAPDASPRPPPSHCHLPMVVDLALRAVYDVWEARCVQLPFACEV